MKIVLNLVFLLVGSSAFAESGTVLNGGDAVFCKASQESEFKGLYSLDYLVTYDKSASPIYQPKNLKESLARISYLIKKKLPELSASFKVFAKNIGNKDPHFTYLWEEANFGLVDVKDEDLVSLLPENCRGQNGKVQLIQAVVRKPARFTGMPGKIVFGYQPKVLDEMYAKAPLQLSFLLVHEWLWEISQNVKVNRRVNRMLHSKRFEEISRNELLSALREMSFVLPGDLSALLFPESCLPDPHGIAQMFPKAGELSDVYGNVQLIGQSKSCGADQGDKCSHMNSDSTTRLLRDYVDPYKSMFGIELSNQNTIYLVSPNGLHMTCTADLKTAYIRCDDLRDRYGNKLLGNGQKFSGTMSRNCIRLQGEEVKDKFETRFGLFWREVKYVVYKRFENR